MWTVDRTACWRIRGSSGPKSIAAARPQADPLRKRDGNCAGNKCARRRAGERLVTAYQEGLVTLPQLRQRMPALQKQTQAVESEWHSTGRGGCRRNKIPAAGRSRGEIVPKASSAPAASRGAGHRGAATDSASAGERSPCWGRQPITLRHSIPIHALRTSPNGSRPRFPVSLDQRPKAQVIF